MAFAAFQPRLALVRRCRGLPLVVACVLGLSICSEWPARLPVNLCVFRSLTGRSCPGCGMTRGFVALGHGRLGEACRANALSPLAYLLACAYLACSLSGVHSRWPGPRAGRIWACVAYSTCVLLVLLFWTHSLVGHTLRGP